MKVKTTMNLKPNIIYVRLKTSTHNSLKKIAKREKEDKSAMARSYIEKGVERDLSTTT